MVTAKRKAKTELRQPKKLSDAAAAVRTARMGSCLGAATNSPEPLADAELVARYQAGLSIRTLVAQTGIPYSTLRRRLHNAGARLRPRGGDFRWHTDTPANLDSSEERGSAMLLEVTTWNVAHGGHDKPTAEFPTGSQHRWEAALKLASEVLTSFNPYRVILIQEAFLWQRLGRLRAFAEATETTPYVAAGRHQLDLAAFVGAALRVGDWKANPGHLRVPALLLPVRPDGWTDDILIGTTHLEPFSADLRSEQILGLDCLLGEALALLGLDANCIGPDDAEPDHTVMPARQLGCHTHLVDDARRWNRRPTQLAQEAGWIDLARHFDHHDIPTGGFGQPFPTVRFDQFWASPELTAFAVDYEVHNSDEFTKVSDHVPVTARFELTVPEG